MIVPYEELSPEALQGVIENFILREGTDYGYRDYTFESKVAQVLKQIKNKQAFIVFDPKTETCSILSQQELEKK